MRISPATAARMRFNVHCAEHGCHFAQCETRRQLWLDYQRAGERPEPLAPPTHLPGHHQALHQRAEPGEAVSPGDRDNSGHVARSPWRR